MMFEEARILYGVKFARFLETASENDLHIRRINLFHGVKSCPFPKWSWPYEKLVYKYLWAVWAIETRFGYPENKYMILRSDGTVNLINHYSAEEAFTYLEWENRAWEEFHGYRLMTEAEIARYKESVRSGNGNPFGPDDFKIGG